MATNHRHGTRETTAIPWPTRHDSHAQPVNGHGSPGAPTGPDRAVLCGHPSPGGGLACAREQHSTGGHVWLTEVTDAEGPQEDQ